MNSSGSTRTSSRPRDGFFSRAATGRWTCQVRFARARVRAEWLCLQQQAPPEMMTKQSIRTYLRRECPLTTRHTAIRSGDSCGNECRTHSRTELRRDCGPEAEAVTRRSCFLISRSPRVTRVATSITDVRCREYTPALPWIHSDKTPGLTKRPLQQPP